MHHHTDMGVTVYARNKRLKQLINEGAISLAGNQRLGIYGTLACSSGKRMKPGNRVFFRDQEEAWALGYRPCGHCLRAAYRQWKQQHS